MTTTLTPGQRKVFDFVVGQYNQSGVSPTIREVQKHFGWASPFAAQRHLDQLHIKGAIQKAPGLARYRVAPGMNFRKPA